MKSGPGIANNVAIYAVARVTKNLLTFAYFVIIARYAGVRVAGLFFLVLAYGTLYLTLTDFGFTNVFIRDTARHPEDIQKNFSKTLSVKLLFIAILLALTLVAFNILDYPPITKTLVYIVVASQILRSLSLSFFGCFRAVQQMQYEAIGMVVGGLITLSGGAIAIYLELSVYYLILAVALDGLFNFIYSAVLVARKLQLVPRLAFSSRDVASLVPIALPFGLSAVFMTIYSIDTVLVSRFMDETHVAWYSIASRLVGGMKLIPITLATVLFPAFSAFHLTDPEGMMVIFRRSERFLMFLVIPMSAGGVLLAAPIIEAIFGADYSESVLPFQIMCVALVPIFLSFPVISLLNAIGGQNGNVANLAVAIAVHVSASLILIPNLGIEGAALSFTVSNLTLLILCQYQARRLVDWGPWASLLRPIGLSTAAMIATVWTLRDFLYLPIVIALGVFVYVGGMVVMRGGESVFGVRKMTGV